MHFATFAGSDFEAFDPIVELEQAKREMGGPGEGKGAQIVGDRWMGGAMGVVDVGETAVVRVGETRPRVLSEERRRAAKAARTYKVWTRCREIRRGYTH